MNKIIPAFFAAVLCSQVSANEVFSADPTTFIIEGNDRYGNEAYSISAKVKREDESLKLTGLSVKIYDQEIQVESKLLVQVINPDFTNIGATNDAGIFGSYFYIGIPFGKRGKCREARKYKLKKSIYISSLDVVSGKGLSAKIYDPCAKP